MVDEFFQSLARAFARNRTALPGFLVAVVVLGAVGAAALTLAGLRRRRSARTRALAFARQRGLGGDDLELARSVARQASVDLLQFLTHLEIFERVTGEALRRGARGRRPLSELEGGIHRVRRGLGFDGLPIHAPLLTTRELTPGGALEVEGQSGRIARVDEGSFEVTLPEPLAHKPGETVALTLAHGREARYGLRCALIAAGRAPGGDWQTVLAHDEAPQRIQMREYVRIPVKGSILLRPVVSDLAPAAQDGGHYAALVDVSGGGARVATAAELAVGGFLRVSFAVADSQFTAVSAEVLSCSRAADGQLLAQLEFRGLPERERERLVSALARLELAQRNEA